MQTQNYVIARKTDEIVQAEKKYPIELLEDSIVYFKTDRGSVGVSLYDEDFTVVFNDRTDKKV